MIEDDDNIYSELDEPLISFTKEEIDALLNECKYSFISYENPIAKSVLRKMMDFVGYVGSYK